MILQALYDFYQRKAADPESKIAPFGFEWKDIPFLIVIDTDGRFINLEDTRSGNAKNRKASSFLLPRSVSRSGTKFIPNLLWDSEEYVLGTLNDSKIKHNTFKNLLFEKTPSELKEDPSVNAILNFYKNNCLRDVLNSPKWEELKKAKNPNITFKIAGEEEPVPCKENVRKILQNYISTYGNIDDESEHETGKFIKGICLITGKKELIARTHQKTFINKDANILVSFQKGSGYDSYGKDQAYNASVGVSAEFAYTTALKMLLEKGSGNKFTIADTTVIFWAEKQTMLEENFGIFFTNPIIKDDTDKNIQSIRAALQSVYSGRLNREGDTKFFILGLGQGGGSRIAMRFWKPGTVKQFSENIAIHYSDLEISHSRNNETEYFTLYNLLRSLVLKGELDNIPPSLPGSLIESIIDCKKPYPAILQQQCLRRLRAEQKVSSIRAAILKACLNRKNRIYNINEKPITMALDPENTNQGYLCGRLFAVLEKIQEEAQGTANIRERFYGAASGTPVTVFGRLLNLSNHHLAKLNPGRRIHFEKLIQEVMIGVNSIGMPAHLSLDDQSRFAVGYYHQRQDLFTSKQIINQ